MDRYAAPHRPASRALHGFTLIELSVVLVIIGLLVAGVIVGQSMIRGSQVQSVLTDEAKYVEAARQFKEKYGYLPGDFPNATSYWGTNADGCPDTSGTSSSKTATCNGDGNGVITGNGSSAANGGLIGESFLVWQHLADASLIEGLYTGATGPLGSTDQHPGINVPSTKFPNGGFQWDYFYTGTPYTNASGWFLNVQLYTQYLTIGAPLTAGGSLYSPLFTPAEAASIDGKADDGQPATGKWTSSNTELNSNKSPCTTTDVASTAAYNITASNKGASGNFKPTQAACVLQVEVDW